MVNTEIRLIIFIAAKDGEALYSQQKQDQDLTVAQIMNSLLPNSSIYSNLILREKELYWSPYEKFGEGNGTPLQYSCLENPMEGGAW